MKLVLSFSEGTIFSPDIMPVVSLASEHGSFVPSAVLLWGTEARMQLPPVRGSGRGAVSGRTMLGSSVSWRKGQVRDMSEVEERKQASAFPQQQNQPRADSLW